MVRPAVVEVQLPLAAVDRDDFVDGLDSGVLPAGVPSRCNGFATWRDERRMSLTELARPAAHLSIFEGFDAATLRAGALEATFVPELGMVGASLRHDGDELLDRREGLLAYRDAGAVMGIPLLHPWANRLGGDAYELHGRRVRLPAGSPLVRRDENGLPIHGLLSAHPGWVVDSLDAGAEGATLQASLDFAGDPRLHAAFPFAHELTIVARLTDRALTIATTITPTGGALVPISFGYHPYLRIPGCDRSEWEVGLPARRHAELDGRGIPTGRGHRCPPARLRLGELAFDDGFDRIADGARFSVSGGGRTLSVRHHEGFPVAQLYSPPGAQFLCFEPMTAPVDALRAAVGLRRAVPGVPFTATFSIAVSEA